MTIGRLGMKGQLTAQRIGCQQASLSWRLRNAMRWTFIVGWMQYQVAYLVAAVFRVPTLRSKLTIQVRRASGQWVDYGTVSYRKITKAGVTALVNNWQAATVIPFNYHGCGTGATAEANTDTVLVTESTTVLNPDNVRATGVKTVVGTDNNILHTEGTVTFDGSAGIQEHGLFSQAATGGGTLWDRSVFSIINVASGDSILFKYECTVAYEA